MIDACQRRCVTRCRRVGASGALGTLAAQPLTAEQDRQLSPATTLIVGSCLWPDVRKLLVFLGLKGLPYRIDPIVPFHDNDDFAHISPLWRVPVLIDDQVKLADSSVICAYRSHGIAMRCAPPVRRSASRASARRCRAAA
jgi:hypothetical protein